MSTLFATSDSPHLNVVCKEKKTGRRVYYDRRLNLHYIESDQSLAERNAQLERERQAEENNRDFLDELEDRLNRRELMDATTWDYFFQHTRRHPMGAVNPLLEASYGWSFGQESLWNEDGVPEPASFDPLVDLYGNRLK